jgi:putative phage terminase, small subunit, P27 family|nr:MAG TPA: terminase small subunit [Caudoviricetes sp.]
MGRPRKIISMQTGNIKKNVRAKREYEESLVKTDKDELEKLPSSVFLDATAKREYERVRKNLQSIDIIGNLDRNSMIVYANAYSMYLQALKETKKKDFCPTVKTSSGEKPNPVYAILEQAKKDMDTSGSALGMSASSRLKIASEKAKGQEENLMQLFGDI